MRKKDCFNFIAMIYSFSDFRTAEKLQKGPETTARAAEFPESEEGNEAPRGDQEGLGCIPTNSD